MTREEFYAYQEKTFDSFCKTVIRNTAATIHTKRAAKAAREISLSAMPDAELRTLGTEDTHQFEDKTFTVNGEEVIIHDPDLACALQCIPPSGRDVILLWFFLDRSEAQIAQMMNLSQSTIDYRKTRALHRLREIMEAQSSD